MESEHLGGAVEFFKKHKALVLVLGIVLLYLLLRRGSGSASASSAGVNPLQIAQLEASQNLQQAQLQAQQNTAVLSAQVQQHQTDDALQAQQDQLAASVAATAYQYKAASDKSSAQEAIYRDLISTGAQEQLAQYSVEGSLAQQIVNKTNLPGHSGLQQTGANELALIFGQGNIGSYNEGNASTSIAHSIETAQIVNGITKTAGSVLTAGLF